MKPWLHFIGNILSKLFLPLTLFFLVLVLLDGAEHKYISPFVIISDLVIIIIFCALAFLIQEELQSNHPLIDVPRKYRYVTYFICAVVAVIIAIQSLYLPAVQNSLVSITALACMVLVLNITQRPVHTYHKLALLGVCVLMASTVISIISVTNGFIIFDFWNHYNSSKSFALTGDIDFLLLSYHTFYILLGSILSIAGTNIIVAQWLYSIGIALLFGFGSYVFYYIGKKLHHPTFGVITAVFFILLPATHWGGLSFFIPNTISLVIWPLLFFFGLQKRTWQTIISFVLICAIILLYHPWDLVFLLPILVLWKMSIHNKARGYPLWICTAAVVILFVEIILYVFFPEQFFALNSFFPGFIGIYNDTISSITNEPNFNPQVLFSLINIPLVPFASLGAITVLIEYIKQRRQQKVQKLTEFLLSQTFIFIALLILAVLLVYNFRIVVFILFASIPLTSYFLYVIIKKHWVLGGMISSVLIGVLTMQNMLVYSQLGQTEYSSRLEGKGITEGIKNISTSSVILTDPYSITYILGFSSHFNTHSNPNHENEYFDIFASSSWSHEQLAYLKQWNIEYIAVTNRTVEWARTGVPTTATNEYVETLDSFLATKRQMRKKFRSVFEVVYSNDDFALYRVAGLNSISVKS